MFLINNLFAALFISSFMVLVSLIYHYVIDFDEEQ